MINLIYNLCSAIATQEGYYSPDPTVRPRRDHNPGDLIDAPWLTHPKHDGGFWQAETDAKGIAGLFHQVALDIARGMSLRQLIYSWAPPKQNNSAAYLASVAMWCAIGDVDAPLWNLLEIRRMP